MCDKMLNYLFKSIPSSWDALVKIIELKGFPLERFREIIDEESENIYDKLEVHFGLFHPSVDLRSFVLEYLSYAPAHALLCLVEEELAIMERLDLDIVSVAREFRGSTWGQFIEYVRRYV